jgi:hypothetical protein
MATIQRNVKTFGTRAFASEVSAAPSNYAPVLSNEVDADLDTIYAAWNGGTDTVNLKDGSVTFAKLASDAQLWRDTGTQLTPGTNFASRTVVVPGVNAGAFQWGTTTGKGRLIHHPSASTSWWTDNAYLSPGTVWVADDATKPSWQAALSAVNDTFTVLRAPAGAPGSLVNLLLLDGTGSMKLPGVGGQPTALYLGTAAAGNMALVSAFLGGGGGPFLDVQANGNQPVAGKAMWGVRLNADSDVGGFLRQAANGGATTNPLQVDGSGNLTIAGANATKAAPGTAWINPSDQRIKKDIADDQRGLTAILALRPRTFRFNGLGGTIDDGQIYHGLIADEVQSVMPEMVGSMPLQLHHDDPERTDILTLDTSNIVYALINAVKELAARVAAVEAA